MSSIIRSKRKTHHHPAWRLVLGLLVCVSLLQIPVPLMHHHSEFASAEDLAVHVDSEHRDGFADADDFHWHLVLPRDLDGNGEHSSEDLPIDVAINAGLGTGVTAGSNLGPFAGYSEELFDLVCADEPTRRNYLSVRQRIGPMAANVGPTVRVCAILCVIRV